MNIHAGQIWTHKTFGYSVRVIRMTGSAMFSEAILVEFQYLNSNGSANGQAALDSRVFLKHHSLVSDDAVIVGQFWQAILVPYSGDPDALRIPAIIKIIGLLREGRHAQYRVVRAGYSPYGSPRSINHHGILHVSYLKNLYKPVMFGAEGPLSVDPAIPGKVSQPFRVSPGAIIQNSTFFGWLNDAYSTWRNFTPEELDRLLAAYTAGGKL